jgi:hypothetical protein
MERHPNIVSCKLAAISVSNRPLRPAHLPQVVIALAELPLRVAAVVCGAHDEWRVDASCDLDGAVHLHHTWHILHTHRQGVLLAPSNCASMDRLLLAMLL